ncbi:MAG TPA: CDP-alcohol phosphatidyltransferase family protein [Flavobacteriales bacterium]|nr:CDP-alcohol phosphatidyltransferase family protein [Flavobacteriales bacterium]
MISIYKIKPRFQQLLMPQLKLLKRLGISPNSITFFSILLSFGIAYFFWNTSDNSSYFLIVAFGLLLRMMLNALDGMMARIYNLQSKLGEVLNEVGDIVSDVAIYFPLIIFESLRIEIAIIFILLSIINEFCGLMAKVISGERRYDGPMGKSDRAFLIGIICIVYYFTNGLDPYMNYIIGGSSIMIILSSYVRLTKSIKNGKNNK